MTGVTPIISSVAIKRIIVCESDEGWVDKSDIATVTPFIRRDAGIVKMIDDWLTIYVSMQLIKCTSACVVAPLQPIPEYIVWTLFWLACKCHYQTTIQIRDCCAWILIENRPTYISGLDSWLVMSSYLNLAEYVE